ncbi:hypothetical protein DMB66_06575 [Actinoplanes sp. ATCC 53533]|uniref:hypothetical protein n=1 Tax=Actinoplanes sp. ATCC 53533 TaxID=1288362 RepID=UPI000F76AE46|nr:hypothetical protein [Actinoplanes sp. ATCC 53533]RSM72250.1 hypothetical protein DMB66_06575 [Actinoplanes sp. ATCC 53533]
MPEDVTARHRAGGAGRLLAVRSASPRHAAPVFAPSVASATRTAAKMPWALSVLAMLMLVVVTPLALRAPDTQQATVPLPTFSVPALPTETDPAPATTRRQLQADRQVIKIGPAPSAAAPSASASASVPASASAVVAPVLLGPASNAELLSSLNSYCRATYGQFTRAMSTADGWVCGTFGRGPVALDLDAMCRWSYGDRARAVLGSATDPQSWRCYRDGP